VLRIVKALEDKDVAVRHSASTALGKFSKDGGCLYHSLNATS